jgi:hypothetical protein
MTDIKGKAKQEEEEQEFDDLEFDKILNAEASLLSRESEVRNPLHSRSNLSSSCSLL